MNIEQTILGYLRIATVSPKVYPGEVKKNLVRSARIAPPAVKLRRNVNLGLIKTRPVKVRAKNALPERIIRIRVVPA